MGVRPLKIAVLVKDRGPNSHERENRAMGLFSYAVPQFTWDYVPLSKYFRLDTREYARKGYDLLFHVDGPLMGEYSYAALPVVYYAIDSSLSHANHYLPRLEMARHASLILVDHDELSKFVVKGRKTFRLSHCVNDKLFYNYGLEKDCEVAFHCNGSGERSQLRVQLHDQCAANGWRYRSGMLPVVDYARSMNAAKVTVNWPRTPANRPHRVFDALATRTCLLTGPLPDVSDEFRENAVHYLEFYDITNLYVMLVTLLTFPGIWEDYANAGYAMVMKHHTWSQRAKELRELLQVEVGL